LRSFPTRRSSDLAATRRGRDARVAPIARAMRRQRSSRGEGGAPPSVGNSALRCMGEIRRPPGAGRSPSNARKGPCASPLLRLEGPDVAAPSRRPLPPPLILEQRLAFVVEAFLWGDGVDGGALGKEFDGVCRPSVIPQLSEHRID